MSAALGATLHEGGAQFRVRVAKEAAQLWLCLFEGEIETRIEMVREGDVFTVDVPGIKAGQRYGYRAKGSYDRDKGLCFDEAKLLVDPYAVALDTRFMYDRRLEPQGIDTAALVPKAIVTAPLELLDLAAPCFKPGGLIYELNVRGFTMQHPDVPEGERGTVKALAHPAIIAHLKKIGVGAVELMPIIAWIDEHHLHDLGLSNAWGYNPVAMMALDPGLVPGGMQELRDTVAALRAAGIGVILDLVFNHTGETDLGGPTLSMRGLDNLGYYTHDEHGILGNDTGCGNTLNCAAPQMRRLILDSLRHLVSQAGVDGFRFDLATVLAREPSFNPNAPIFAEIADDPVLGDRIMIAEPWDIGPGGYQLGAFPAPWLEWNGKYRDDVRRFWRGDDSASDLATRLCGSSDIFNAEATRSVNFIIAHDGFTLADLVSYEERHNEANGEDNRDGSSDNSSWNNGAEGPTDDPDIIAARKCDLRALHATLIGSRGSIMIAAGDEFGRTQQGNNNAYAQDNEISWVDWVHRDHELEDYFAELMAFRNSHPALSTPEYPAEVRWFALDGAPMDEGRWQDPHLAGMELQIATDGQPTLFIRIDRQAREVWLFDK